MIKFFDIFKHEKMSRANTKTNTKLYPNIISEDIATETYIFLKNNVRWHKGVYSKKGATRLSCSADWDGEIGVKLMPLIITALNCCNLKLEKLTFCYLNYYRDGNDWTPSHSHKDTIQVIISLGATRELVVGKKSYNMSNGDVAIFGASMHSITKNSECTRGRISIALFLDK
jgi:hypothetical protein